MKILIMNNGKATPAIFKKHKAAYKAAIRKCEHVFRIIDERILQDYVNEIYGDDYYAAYEPFEGAWYVHKRAPYDTSDCDWCSVGGNFCDYCFRYGEDFYECCGEPVNWENFFNWFEKGGL